MYEMSKPIFLKKSKKNIISFSSAEFAERLVTEKRIFISKSN